MQNEAGSVRREAIEACVCYTIDEGYLLPALVSAIQARGQLKTTTADIIIVVFGKRGARASAAEAVAAQHGVKMMFAEPDAIDHRHIMFARLYLHRLLPTYYRRIVYIDGDTQVKRDLTPLVETPIQPGWFLACRDPAAVLAQLSDRWRRRIANERKSVGFARPYADYFNSGVLVIETDTWAPLAEACFAQMDRSPARTRYPDQDVLNLAIGERCTLISNRWNFPGFFIGSPAEARLAPHIYHFMSNPRPWNEPVRPWGPAWARPYSALIEQHPQLSEIAPRRSGWRSLRYWLQQEIKIATAYSRAGRLSEPEPDLIL